MKHLLLALGAGLVAGCASTDPAASGNPSAAGADTKLAQAAVTPLNDINLVRARIPPVLAAAQKGPYAAPADASCTGLLADVRALDEVLGADLDTPPTASNPGLIERGSSAAGDAVVGAVRNTTEGVIPFRGWVRKLTGAERYAREVAAAIAAGTVRRAYLKGLGQAAGCPAPAASRG
ncbi:MAG: hypothetical protein KF788_20900 [Piscinibacter sp.]|nr:hypothetical protein [Piscinibacter sp.]